MSKSKRIKKGALGHKDNSRKLKRVGTVRSVKTESAIMTEVGEIFSELLYGYISTNFIENVEKFEEELKLKLTHLMKYITYSGLKSDFGHWHDLHIVMSVKK